MSLEENKRLVKQYIEDVVNTGNLELVEKFISSDYIENYDGKSYPVGIKGAKDHLIGVRTTYPDLHLTIEQQIAEDDWVATCITARGTHTGNWLGMKPTGKLMTYTGVNIDKVINGKIVEHGGAANQFLELLEAGAIQVVGEKEKL